MRLIGNHIFARKALRTDTLGVMNVYRNAVAHDTTNVVARSSAAANIAPNTIRSWVRNDKQRRLPMYVATDSATDCSTTTKLSSVSIVGFVAGNLCRAASNDCVVTNLSFAVRPDYQHQGIALYLLRIFMEDIMSNHGEICRVYANLEQSNCRAASLLQYLGYHRAPADTCIDNHTRHNDRQHGHSNTYIWANPLRGTYFNPIHVASMRPTTSCRVHQNTTTPH